MKTAAGPAGVEVRYADRVLRQKHREDTRTFLRGTWIFLILALFMAISALEGFESGEWVDLGTDASFPVPWWIAAVVTLVALLTSIWCFYHYILLKESAPAQASPTDDGDDAAD